MYLPPGYNTKELESGVKNKWRWEWLNERGSLGEKWGDWLKKPNTPGSAYCEICFKTINYKSNGKKAFKSHAEDVTHLKNYRTWKSNQVLPGSSKAKPETESMQDRVAKQRAITAAFISEHCLPFSIAEDLLNYAKRLSEDKHALGKTTISKTSATYIITHGLAKSFKQEVADKVKGKSVSLNLDEATNNNNDKIVNILIQFYDEEENQIVLRHLGSRKQNHATAKDIMMSIESVLEEYKIEWWQVVSMLMEKKFYSHLRTGYVMAAIKMLKMPLNNHTIRQMTVLDPALVGHSQVEQAMKNLGKKMPQVLSKEDLGALSQEASIYNVDLQVKDLQAKYKEDDRIDSGYWVKVFDLNNFCAMRYPTIKKLVMPLLTVFSGPLIESTFNIMDDIIEKDRTKMTVVNYEAVAIVKTALRKKNVKSTDLKVTPNMKKACISAYSSYQKYLKEMKEEKKKREDAVLDSSVQLLKLERAKKIAKLVRLKNRHSGIKRKPDTSSDGTGRKWKRIKKI
ncbi:hypothetical protein DPMN_183918 [Dreissena polymorpha]|uniref:Uncharacterized protein n=1 Tax=Dreissena polymorpha TaxID=45954 RepID=A0A9D4DJB6_DREPO|nr:hypothetical protein DPMN_183918 [Dreissena polymorpha]